MKSKLWAFIAILLFLLVKVLLATLVGMVALIVVKHYLLPDLCRLCVVAVFSFWFGLTFWWLRGLAVPKL